MQFSISRGQAAVLLAAGVVLSPVLIPAAIVYTAGAKIREVARNTRYTRRQRKAQKLAQKISELSDQQKELQRLFKRMDGLTNYLYAFEFALALFSLSDFHASVKYFDETVKFADMAIDAKASSSNGALRQKGLALYYKSLALQQCRRFSEALEALKGAREAMEFYEVVPGEVTLSSSDILAAEGYIMYLQAVYEVGPQDEVALLDRALAAVEEAIARAGDSPDASYFATRAWIHYEMAWTSYRTALTKPATDDVAALIRPQFASMAVDDIAIAEAAASSHPDATVPMELLLLRVNALYVAGRQDEAIEASHALHEAVNASGAVDLPIIDLADPSTTLADFATPFPLEELSAVSDTFMQHELEPVTLKKPTWCDVCRKFITLAENIKDKNCECVYCHQKCHERCKAQLLENSCIALRAPHQAAAHQHFVSIRFIHSPHDCVHCHKVIMMMQDAYCCESCSAFFHVKCVMVADKVVPTDGPMYRIKDVRDRATGD